MKERATDLPVGVVTFVFTDIEGSTRLLNRLGDAYSSVLREHQQFIFAAIDQHGGAVVRTDGDGVFAAFGDAAAASGACADAQAALHAHRWPAGSDVRVRMGLHTGPAAVVDDDYVGLAVHQAARIAAAGHGGQVLMSAATVAAVGEAWPADAQPQALGEFLLKDFDDPQPIFQLADPRVPSVFPALMLPRAEAHNLPRGRTSFIGRDRELVEVPKLLERHRFVTLLGPGGTGKTRLALEVAAGQLTEHTDGVWLVELAGAQDGDDVLTAIAATVGTRVVPGTAPAEALVAHLASRRLLLVLDNCEHIVEPVATLVDALMVGCPTIAILTTSRQALGLTGEVEYRVAPLDLPPTNVAIGRLPVEAIAGHGAIRLFVDRAELANPAFTLDAGNAAAVVELCRRLDALPLALELAAARSSLLTPREIVERLDEQFQMEDRASMRVAPRLRSLSATVMWSYDLLDEQAQFVLRAASTFRGGCTIAALAAVADRDEPAVVQSVTALVDRSLVQADVSGELSRYRLLETIREFAWSVTSEDQRRELETRHREWFLAMAESAAPQLRSSEQRVWLARLDADYDNLREALRTAVGDDPVVALRLAVALAPFWDVRGYLRDGRRWLEHALEATDGRTGEATPKLRCQAVGSMGRLAVSQGDLANAVAHFEEARVLALVSGDRQQLGSALNGLGTAHVFRAEYDAAKTVLGEAVRILREAGELPGVAAALGNLGNAAFYQGDQAAARASYEEALAIFRTESDARGIAISLLNLGNLAHDMGDNDLARSDLTESLAMSRELGDGQIEGRALLDLGNSVKQQGDLDAAAQYFAEALEVARRLDSRRVVTEALMAGATLPNARRPAARRDMQEARAISQVVGDHHIEALALIGLADFDLDDRFVDHALAGALSALHLAVTADETPTIVRCLDVMANIAVAQRDLVSAARRAGAAGFTDDEMPADLVVAMRAADQRVLDARAEGRALGPRAVAEITLAEHPDLVAMDQE